MNPIDPDLLRQGSSYRDYRQRVERNSYIFDEVYARPAYTPGDLDFLRRLPPLHLVAIGEDWCPDVFHTLPTWARVAEEVDGWKCTVFERDRFPQLMDCFLYQGKAKRVPVYAFYDERHYLQTWWSGRSAEAQRAVDGWLAGKRYDELDEAGKQDLGRRFAEGYRETFRRSNFCEILQQLAHFFHVAPPES